MKSDRDPTIVSLTLTGNTSALIGDALRSVLPWVDLCLVIDTGVTDDTLQTARSIAGEKYRERCFPWRDDFAAARNFALDAANELGASWAVILDTDERIEPNGVDIKAMLANTDADVLSIIDVAGTYEKERFFRLPVVGRYAGRTHEYYDANEGRRELVSSLRFSEVPKTDDRYRHKFERDVAILLRQTEEFPDDPRWFYYLGESYKNLHRYEEAIDVYERCAGLPGWDAQAAWACYRAAECCVALEQWDRGVFCCAVGLGHHAGLAELAWLAGYCCWNGGRSRQAVYWSDHAIALGRYAGEGWNVSRSGFRHPPGLYEGPYDVLRFALRALGDEQGAEEAEILFQRAREAREADQRST